MGIPEIVKQSRGGKGAVPSQKWI